MFDLISIIIPIYNVEIYLRQCLDSIVNQTYKNLEIILIDDGSPDKCGEICDEYALNDIRVKVIHKKNEGVSAARNYGIKIAKGKWIAFVDPDDWLDCDYFKKMLLFMPGENVDVFCGGGHVLEYPEAQKKKLYFDTPIIDLNGTRRNLLYAKVLAPCSDIGIDNKFTTIAFVWNKLYRTSFLQDGEIFFNTQLHPQEDILFNLYALEKATSFASCEYIGYHYRQCIGTSALQRFNPNWPEMGKIFLTAIEKFVEQQPVDSNLETALNYRALTFTKQILRCYFFHPDNKKLNYEIATEMQDYKTIPLINKMIISENNVFTKNQIRLIHLLRYRWIFPLKVLFTLKEYQNNCKLAKSKRSMFHNH